eukprot:c21323_g1_i1 orf=119-817(-)
MAACMSNSNSFWITFPKLLVASTVLLGSLHLCAAEEFPVVWTLNYNYTNWTVGKTFHVNDTIFFNYVAKTHDVEQVDRSSYDRCTNSTTYFNDESKGNTTIKLNSTGSHYFICTFPDHCSSFGMKLAVDVIAAAIAPSPAPASNEAPSPAPTPSSVGAPSPNTTPSPSTTPTPSQGSSSAPSPISTVPTSPGPPSPPSAQGPSGGSNIGSNLVKPASAAVWALVTVISVFLH